jgi:hypothetical protein
MSTASRTLPLSMARKLMFPSTYASTPMVREPSSRIEGHAVIPAGGAVVVEVEGEPASEARGLPGHAVEPR